MKMKIEDFNELKDSVIPAAKQLKSLAEYKERGLSETRYLWDVLWNSRIGNNRDWFTKIYEYCNDDNITTALKKILIP